MTNTITLSIETEQFTNLLKSIQTRLKKLDDRKPPIIKEMPFIPDVLVSKILMMARPTYPYIQEIKEMVKFIEDWIHPSERVFRHLPIIRKDKLPSLWFHKYCFIKKYDIIQQFHNDWSGTAIAMHVIRDFTGNRYKAEAEGRIPFFKKPGLIEWKKDPVGASKKYERTVLHKSIEDWLLNGGSAPSKTKAMKKHYDAFVSGLELHIEYVLSSPRMTIDRGLGFEYEKITKKFRYYYTTTSVWNNNHAFDLNIDFYQQDGKVCITELQSYDVDYDDFHS